MSVKANGKPGEPRNAVQFNDAGAFAGDSGLTYDQSISQLVISGDEDKSTPLFKAHAGDFHAYGIVETFVPDADVLYTAVDIGDVGNDITITYDVLGVDQSLAVAVVGSDITVHLESDGGGLSISTASDVLTAVNADGSANLLVIATLAPGNDGSGIVSGFASMQLSGGASAADVAWIDERGVVNVQLQTGLGENAINVRDPDGTIVAHIDNDGGVVFSEGRFTLSQSGSMTVDVLESVPLLGNTTLRYSVNGFGLFTIAAGGGYGFSVNSPVATDILFNVAAGTGQTGDLLVAFDEDFVKGFRVLPRGAIVIAQHTAPDDSDLAAGQMAIWFDQTDGAASMMIKAKTADGTVATGAVPLA